MAYSELFNLQCTTKTSSILNNSLVSALNTRELIKKGQRRLRVELETDGSMLVLSLRIPR